MADSIKKVPIPIHSPISEEGKPSRAFVRYLTKLQEKIQELEDRILVLETP